MYSNLIIIIFCLVPVPKSMKCVTLEDSLTILMNGFLRGGSGFLKGTGEIIKGTTGSHREVRVGVTYVNILLLY